MLENITKTFNIIFNKEGNMKAKGTVKWFNPDKGYGFVAPDNGKKDVFIHMSALKEAGLDNLDEDQKIEYEVVEEKGRESATNIKLI
jgi:CspA family cold shock protein